MLTKFAKQTWPLLSQRCLSGSVHATAKVGFENIGDQYERGRPTYSQNITDYYFNDDIINIGPNDTIIDIAAGTGKLTQILSSYYPQTKIKAIEPTSSFRDIMNDKFKDNDKISVYDGIATDLSFIESDSISAIFGGQCFHWFAVLNALKEFQRILIKNKNKRKKSHLFFIWNIMFYDEKNEFLKELRDDVIHLYHGNTDIKHCKFEPMKDRMEQLFDSKYLNDNGLLFKPTKYDFHENTHKQYGDVNMIIDRVLSNSIFGTLETEERERLERKIMDIVVKHFGGLDVELSLPYSTYVLHSYIQGE